MTPSALNQRDLRLERLRGRAARIDTLRGVTAVDLIVLREALEASWSRRTSYRGVWDERNPALGQCYPTARVVQHFLPAADIVKGSVWTGVGHEVHFWNELRVGFDLMAIDLTWQQFPPGSVVTSRQTLDRHELGDTPATIGRCDRLLAAVDARLNQIT